VTDTASLVGDFVVMRRDGWPAYQLAVVVDDARQGITQVIRGMDLLDSVARQVELHRLLGYEPPGEWAHLGLVVDADGERLAKRRDGLSLLALRQRGNSPERVLGMLGHSLGLLARPEPVKARDLVAGFRWEKIPVGPWRLDHGAFL
jgi:glutamyl-tRNA synthetase